MYLRTAERANVIGRARDASMPLRLPVSFKEFVPCGESHHTRMYVQAHTSAGKLACPLRSFILLIYLLSKVYLNFCTSEKQIRYLKPLIPVDI